MSRPVVGMLSFLLILASFCAASPRIVDNRTFKFAQTEDSSPAEEKDHPTTLKLMTFNTWLIGSSVNDGLAKIAKHIKLVDPDIVGLQEIVSNDKFYQLIELLGDPWTYAYINDSNSAIVTKHKVVQNSTYVVQAGIGAQILIDEKIPVNAYSMHLAYRAYGPYALYNKLVKNFKAVDIGESWPSYSRVNNIKNLIADKKFQHALKLTNSIPLIVFGDFNTPSHLDWTEEAKDQHEGIVYKWPATHLLQTKTKLVDTYREVYPNPSTHPGITWSTIYDFSSSEWNWSIPEPHDRIDFIYYRSQQLRTIDSQPYAGEFKPYPADVKQNDWPSDHYAVVSKLEWVERKVIEDKTNQ
ncbi:Endo/exonuclease/phosphatase domain-containing protein [Aphelenchoides bicaudatus]|nr:Endo/exonuclease/phosphatase domain-containing protein [Aphelenchoides bicaudatus]